MVKISNCQLWNFNQERESDDCQKCWSKTNLMNDTTCVPVNFPRSPNWLSVGFVVTDKSYRAILEKSVFYCKEEFFVSRKHWEQTEWVQLTESTSTIRLQFRLSKVTMWFRNRGLFLGTPPTYITADRPDVHKCTLDTELRNGWRYQNGWFFGKIPNGLWPPPSPRFRKVMLHFFRKALFKALYKGKKSTI